MKKIFSSLVIAVTMLFNSSSYAQSTDLASKNFVLKQGGAYQAGSIFSDQNWGMIFRGATNLPQVANFLWSDYNNVPLMGISKGGTLRIGSGWDLSDATGYKLFVQQGGIWTDGGLTLGAGSTIYSPANMHINGEQNLYIMNKLGVTVSKYLGGTGNLFAEGNCTVSGEIFTSNWFRNYNAGSGLFNQATLTGIYSPSSGLMAIYNNGSLRIGDAINTPAGYKLYVQTGILTEKVKVAVANSTNWADYVFSPDYQLKNLTEVEQFIKANKHLPNIPSADEMVKEGNDLGKTDAKLLEKIEELTLYVIELKKEIDVLKNQSTAKK